MNVHEHEHGRPQRHHDATFWGRKMVSWRRFDASGARRTLDARYAVLKGHRQ